MAGGGEAPAAAVKSEQEAGQAPDPNPAHLDLISLLQQKIIQQSATIFNFLGALQQKAPPEVAITAEKVSDAPEDPEWPAVLEMPQALVTQMRDIETLAKLLPQTASEDDDVAEIVQLLEQDAALTAQLRDALELSEGQLRNGHAVAELLGMHVLGARADRALLGAGRTANKAEQPADSAR